MKNYKLHLPEGFKDTLGYEMLIKKEIEKNVLNTFVCHGYNLIKTPGVEYIDIYSLDGIQTKDLYNLINRQGEVLALSNDMTKSIARYVASIKEESFGVKKFGYISDTYRYPRQYQGKNHQFLQAGVELIGKSNLYNDAEVIYLAYKTLKNCNVNNFTIHLGSSEFLHQLLDDFNVSEDNKSRISEAIDNKDYVTLKQLLIEDLDTEKTEFIIDLMLRGGHLRYLESLMTKLKGYKSYNALEYLKNIYQILSELNVDNIIFDFSIYSYAKYYTGIVFQIYVDEITKNVVSGGRCDSLIKEFGKDLPDVGFGLDIDSLTLYIIDNNLIDIKQTKYLSLSDKESFAYAMKNNEKIREEGIIVSDSHLENIKDANKYAKLNGYSKILKYFNNKLEILEVK